MKILFNPDYKDSEKIRFEYIIKDIKKSNVNNHNYNLLDIGCSQYGIKHINKNINIFGIDIQRTYIYDKAHFKKCDLNKEKIPFENQYFDFIIAGEIIEHIKRPFEFIEDLSRLLKRNGILYLTTPNPYYYLEIFKELIGNTSLDDNEHLNLFSRNYLMNYCKKNGLLLLSERRYKFWIPFIKLMILSIHTPKLLNYQQIFKFKKIQ